LDANRSRRSDDAPPAERIGGPADVRTAAAVCAGGAAGALARLGLAEWVPFSGHGWPWATFCANTVGTVLLAYVVTRLQERLPPSSYRRPALATGFCGGLTTFSTFQVELLRLAHDAELALAAGYALASLAVGLGSAVVVTKATRRGWAGT
jgi:CrcB protein